MDNFNINNPLNEIPEKPIPLDQEINKPIPFDTIGEDNTGVSHSPLDLGGTTPIQAPKIEAPKPVAQKPTKKVVSTDRITGIKTFFTKLHPGAMNFLDEQITKWLNENPDVTIKRTNIVTGQVQSKKTEPNIIITVWY